MVAAVEKETSGMLRIEKMLLLSEDGKQLKLIGGDMTWNVDVENEMLAKFTLAMIACQGDTALIMRLPPDRIRLTTPKEFDELLNAVIRLKTQEIG